MSDPSGNNWRSFDLVAEEYDRVRAPLHLAPGRDLVDAVGPPEGARVLDVGAGTGAATVAARERTGPGGMAVAVDPAVEMLRRARARGITRTVGGTAIDLPFRDGTFDAVIANFVIFIFNRYETALDDMLRVLRYGGRMGISTWAGGQDEFGRTWQDVAESFIGPDLLRAAGNRAAPWLEHFSDRHRLHDALRAAGLRSLRVEQRSYRATVSLEDYLTGRETSARGRYLREMLGPALWERFRERSREEFHRRFPDPIGDTSDVLIAVGTRPS